MSVAQFCRDYRDSHPGATVSEVRSAANKRFKRKVSYHSVYFGLKRERRSSKVFTLGQVKRARQAAEALRVLPKELVEAFL